MTTTPRPYTLGVAVTVLALLLAFTPARAQTGATRALPSWSDGPSKRAIVGFVEKVTKAGAPDFVPAAERIATFDNDGTLWAEQPMYFQARFVFDRIKALAPQHPEWKDREPFASVLKGDLKSALAGGEHALLEMAMATHAGMTTEEYVHHDDARREWAYDRQSSIGKLDKGLDEAKAKGWTVVSMKDEWKRVFPFEK